MEEDIAKHADDEDDSWADALKFNHAMYTTVGERTMENRAFRARCREDNPLISSEELKALQKKENIRTMLEWRRGVLQGEKDFLLSAVLEERIKEEELLMRGPAQDALLKEYALSLTLEERVNIYAVVREANPKAGAEELGKILRAAKVQAALAWHKNKVRDAKTSSLSLSGSIRSSEPTSLEAQPKSDASTTERYYISLTKEETAPIRIATELANPGADAKALNKAYKLPYGKQTA
jgi:hypothetical protein